MLKRYTPFLGFLIVLLTVFIWAENQFAESFQQCIGQEATKQTAKHSEDHYQIVGVSIENEAICSLRLIDRHNGFFAALTSLVIAGFTYTLWRSSTRQADLTRDAMIAGERAFVFAIGLKAFWDIFADPDKPIYIWRFRPQWRNSGDTPTKNMTMHTNVLLLDKPLPKGFNFNYATAQVGTALIPPNTEITGGLAPYLNTVGITAADIDNVAAGKKHLYIMGWAKYWDVFPDTPMHITRFCWYINISGDLHTEKTLFGYSAHTEGNCADDECKV